MLGNKALAIGTCIYPDHIFLMSKLRKAFQLKIIQSYYSGFVLLNGSYNYYDCAIFFASNCQNRHCSNWQCNFDLHWCHTNICSPGLSVKHTVLLLMAFLNIQFLSLTLTCKKRGQVRQPSVSVWPDLLIRLEFQKFYFFNGLFNVNILTVIMCTA